MKTCTRLTLLTGLLASTQLYGITYTIEVHLSVSDIASNSPFTTPAAAGHISLNPGHINPIGFPQIQGESHILSIGPIPGSQNSQPINEVECIDDNIITHDSRASTEDGKRGAPTGNISFAKSSRPIPYKKQKLVEQYDAEGFYKKSGYTLVDIEDFPNFLQYATLKKGKFARKVFTSGTIGKSANNIHYISDFSVSESGVVNPIGAEYYAWRYNRPGRLTLQKLIQHLIDHGSVEGMPEDQALTDDLFHILYDSRLEICFTSSSEKQRTIKIVVTQSNSLRYIIYISGTPAQQSAASQPVGTESESCDLSHAAAQALQCDLTTDVSGTQMEMPTMNFNPNPEATGVSTTPMNFTPETQAEGFVIPAMFEY